MNLVFAHGILGFRERFGVEYFRDIREHFEKAGVRVLVTEVDPTAGIMLRGEQLRTQILGALKNGLLDAGQPTHVIGHSMGGLDARFMLSPANKNTTTQNDLSVRIQSLTTVGTPHRGSPIADLLSLQAAQELSPFKHVMGIVEHLGIPSDALKEILNHLGISTEGLLNLTTQFSAGFNHDFPDNPKVRYFSVAGKGRSGLPQTAAVLFPLYIYIKAHTGEENDGLVAVSSARWGNFDSNLWTADHAEEVGNNLDNLAQRASFGYLDKYDQMVRRASAI